MPMPFSTSCYLLLACIAAAPASAQQNAAPPPACATPEHRQFDFWIGRWNVYRTGTDQLVGRNLIERVYEGCTLREDWAPIRGGPGGSFTSWLPDKGIWRQIWVDSRNGWVVFEGGFENGAMTISGRWKGLAGPGSEPLVRMRYSREAGGSVRQLGEMSLDEGQSWRPAFDLTYRPVRTSD